MNCDLRSYWENTGVWYKSVESNKESTEFPILEQKVEFSNSVVGNSKSRAYKLQITLNGLCFGG